MARAGARCSWWVACAAGLTAGCASYTATLDDDVLRGDLRVKIESARALRPPAPELQVFGPGGRRPRPAEITLTVEQIPEGVTLVGAQLGRHDGPLCTLTQKARLQRAGGLTASAPLQAGERLTLGFSPAFEIVREESPRLDLLLETPEKHLRCVPLAVGEEGRPPAWNQDQHFALGVGFGVEAFTSPLGSVTQLGVFPLTVGYWFGPYRAEAAVAIGLAGCPKARCPVSNQDQDVSSATVLHLSAGLGRTFFEWSYVSLGATIRYRAAHLAANTFNGPEEVWMHGPLVAPYVGVVPSVSGGGGGAREFVLGLEIPVGYAFAENGDQSPTIGVNLVLLGTVL